MQSTIFEPQNLPELPAAGFIDHRILESPLPLALIFLAIGIIVFMALRQSKHAKAIGLPALTLAIISASTILVLGALITTDHEHLKARSRQLVLATSTADRAALGNLLDERVRVQSTFTSAVGRDRIIDLAATRGAPMIGEAAAKQINAGIYNPQLARTQIKIKASAAAGFTPPISWWAIDWTRPDEHSDQWVVTHIEPIWIQGISNPTGSN